MKLRVYDLVTEYPDDFELIGGPAIIEFEGVCDDTRELQPGQLFVALKGPNSDGHDYCTKAVIGGATALLVERERPAPGHVAVIRCSGSVLGYLKVGRYIRQQIGCGVCAVTGTVGKTTVRQMIAAMIDMTGPVAVNEENQNAETGVARVLCSLTRDHRAAVIEMGMRDAGEIDLLCRHALPDVGVITHVTPCHLDKLGSIKAVAKAKGELNRYLAENDSPCLINAEAACLDELIDLNPNRTLLYGKDERCGVRLAGREELSLTRQRIRVGFEHRLNAQSMEGWRLPHEPAEFELGLGGEFQAINALPAIAVGYEAGLTHEEIQAALNAVEVPGMRARTVRHASGAAFYLDCYNASPASLDAALRHVASAKGFQKRVAVLGDMLELGSDAASFHQQAGKTAVELGFDELLVFGELSRETGRTAELMGAKVSYFDDHAVLNAAISELLAPETIFLVKGSNGMRLWQALEGFELD